VVRVEAEAAAARQRLVQADRLSTLGTLAAGVAHEINNPAGFIVLGLDMLARTLSGPDVSMDPAVAGGVAETVRELRASIRRIADIIRDLRVFASPPGPGRRALVDVNRTVESALSLTRGQILECAELDRQLEEVPPVLMDDGGLGQVVVNLLVNAAQAVRAGGGGGEARIGVATRSDGSTVEIEITDTGPGIPAEHLPRIWQPFFTTKGPEVGTGLGLSIARDIVERAGGTLTVESPVGGTRPPSGARFVVSLPAAGRDEPAGERASPVPSQPRPARVLVVDDEPALLRALAEEIGRSHEVVVAGSGDAALARLAEGRFDAVLCDLCMPGLTGEAFFERVRAADPAQAEAFIFMTGVGFGADVERLMAVSGRPVLEKPFPAGVALEAIARVARKRAR
jgi:nitrogen-specific signal transduction histidine kinase